MTKTKNLAQVDFSKMSEEDILNFISEKEVLIKVDDSTDSAQKWWSNFRIDHNTRLEVIAQTVAEVEIRKKTLNDFFYAYLYSYTDNIQANLFFMDYMNSSGKDFKKLEKTVNFLNLFKEYSQKVLNNPDIIQLLESQDFQIKEKNEQAKDLLKLAKDLGIEFLEDSPEDWSQWIHTAYLIDKSTESFN